MRFLIGMVCAIALASCGPNSEKPISKLDFVSQECKDIQVKDSTGAFVNMLICAETYSVANKCTVVESKTDANGNFLVGVVCYKENQPPKQ